MKKQQCFQEVQKFFTTLATTTNLLVLRHKNSDICRMNGPISSTKYLEGCSTVRGALVFSQNATSDTINSKVRRIDGCLRIEQTYFTNLDFLSTDVEIMCKKPTGNRISNNNFLCVSEKQISQLEKSGLNKSHINVLHNQCREFFSEFKQHTYGQSIFKQPFKCT